MASSNRNKLSHLEVLAKQPQKTCSLTIEKQDLFLGKKWLTTREAALYLGTTPGGIRNRVYRGHITPKKFYGRCLFDRNELDFLIETPQRRKR